MPQKKLYNKKSIYSDYAKRDYLFKPEKSILEEMNYFLKDARMLDMGVGAGRTTRYFAPAVRSYIGADYAHEMISECRKKFGDKYVFVECDARQMSNFSDDSFDFVLFSYNGIDSFGLVDRTAVLGEVKRVLSDGGYFCFSSHNLDWKKLKDLFNLKYIFKKNYSHKSGIKAPGSKISAAFKSIFIYLRLRLLNRSFSILKMLKKANTIGFTCIYDNSLEGRAKISYISYDRQLKQLRNAGFEIIASYEHEGKKAKSDADISGSPWIYYLCKVCK